MAGRPGSTSDGGVAADRRVHLVGKGVLRFHAVYWPAMLLSAGQPLPTDILVHDYLTTDGRKISKSGGGTPDPVALVRQFGTDSVRWWLLREVPRVGDTDFTAGRLIARANADLAGGLGNLVSRTVAMVHRYRAGVVPSGGGQGRAGGPGAGRLRAACERAPGLVDAALGDFDFRAAADAAWEIVDQANRYIEDVRPWQLARSQHGPAAARLDAALALLIGACRCVACQLAPLVPATAARVAAQCTRPARWASCPTPSRSSQG